MGHEKLLSLQEVVLNPCTYRLPSVDSVGLKRQSTGSRERNVVGVLPFPVGILTLKGDVDVCADALLVKREDVLTFLAAPATIGGTNLGFQVEKSM